LGCTLLISGQTPVDGSRQNPEGHHSRRCRSPNIYSHRPPQLRPAGCPGAQRVELSDSPTPRALVTGHFVSPSPWLLPVLTASGNVVRLGQRWQRQGRCRGAAGTLSDPLCRSEAHQDQAQRLGTCCFPIHHARRAAKAQFHPARASRAGILRSATTAAANPWLSYRCDVAVSVAGVAGVCRMHSAGASVSFPGLREGGGARDSKPIVRCSPPAGVFGLSRSGGACLPCNHPPPRWAAATRHGTGD